MVVNAVGRSLEGGINRSNKASKSLSTRTAALRAVHSQNAIATSFAPSISVVCGPPGIEALADRACSV